MTEDEWVAAAERLVASGVSLFRGMSEAFASAAEELQELFERLGEEAPPESSLPPLGPLVVSSFPRWPEGAQFRGAAPWRTMPGHLNEVQVQLRPRTEGSSSSDGHDVHVLVEPMRRYSWSVDLRLDAAMLDAITWKFGGAAAFDGDWDAWPGGSTSKTVSPANAMERLVGQNTSVARDRPRFGVYATFPQPVAEIPVGSPGVQTLVGGHSAWVTNRGHTCHWELPVAPIAERWYHHRRDVDYDAGTLEHFIDDVSVLKLTGLPWPTTAMNRIYVSCMIGGSDASFLPRTPDRTGTLGYTSFNLFKLLP